ncbi:MAG: DUF3105 domain-containing protein [Actinobacteria bacterium]|nr:DUF3105 domain-containing protein [Actinomycetota bacterium]
MAKNNARARLAEIRRQEEARLRRRRIIGITAGTVAVVVVVVIIIWAVGRTVVRSSSASAVVSYPGLARDHVDGPVSYKQTPPAGGPHAAVWQNSGIYSSPVPNENAVHSLEHGAIWITYRPDLPANQVTELRGDVTGQPYGLLSPYPGLPAPVVATVWGVQLTVQDASDPQLKAFIAKYADGSQAPEPRGECTGGEGTPLSR